MKSALRILSLGCFASLIAQGAPLENAGYTIPDLSGAKITCDAPEGHVEVAFGNVVDNSDDVPAYSIRVTKDGVPLAGFPGLDGFTNIEQKKNSDTGQKVDTWLLWMRGSKYTLASQFEKSNIVQSLYVAGPLAPTIPETPHFPMNCVLTLKNK